MGVFGPKCLNHGHASELIVEGSNIKRRAAEILDSKHELLNLSSQCRQGLLRAFWDTEELVICHKAAAGLLLDEDLLWCTPSLCGVILVHSDVNSLVGHNVEHELASCSVLLDVPSSLVWACSGQASLFSIHKSP